MTQNPGEYKERDGTSVIHHLAFNKLNFNTNDSIIVEGGIEMFSLPMFL